MPALGLCQVALPGHHFLSPVFVRAHKFGCSSNIHVCLPSPPGISMGFAPLISTSKALLTRLPCLGMACKNGTIQVEFRIFLKSSGELANSGSLLCVVICPQRSTVASQPWCPPFPVIGPWPVLIFKDLSEGISISNLCFMDLFLLPIFSVEFIGHGLRRAALGSKFVFL